MALTISTEHTMPTAFRKIPELSGQDKARFWSKVSTCRENECWVWMGGKNRYGYGKFKCQGITLVSSRVAFAISNKSLRPDLCVLHSCDNPPFVNPSHLFIGTFKDNTEDMFMKGRNKSPSGDANGARKHPEKLARGCAHGFYLHPESVAHGETHCFAKLSQTNVDDIRRRFSGGGISQTSIAEEFGLNQSTISKIVRNKSWKHVPIP